MKQCNRCLKVKTNEEFNVRHYKTGIVGLKSKCKVCRHEERMEWRARNPHDNERNKAYNQEHAEEIRGKKLVKYWPQLTWQEALFAWNRLFTSQNFACAICKKQKKLLHVDHCHSSQKVRGLLCYNCNNGVGRFKDSPVLLIQAAQYLEG